MTKFHFMIICGFLFICGHSALAQTGNEEEESELAKINRELDNPLAKRWSLVFQENLSVHQGYLVDGNVVGTNVGNLAGNNVEHVVEIVLPILEMPKSCCQKRSRLVLV